MWDRYCLSICIKAVDESGHITGMDVNEMVLEKARKKCPPNVTPIEWKQGDVMDLPFSDTTFDVVLCQQGLQYFPDRPRALNEINRVLVNRGRVVFSVWRPIEYLPFYSVLHNALEQYVSAETFDTRIRFYCRKINATEDTL